MVLFSNKDYSPIKDSASLIGNPCDATKALAEMNMAQSRQ